MFFVDAVFEDTHFHALSNDGKQYVCRFHDNQTDELKDVTLTAEQLSFIMQINLDNDGEPAGFEKMYESLEPVFKDWPNNLRPIP